jgi:hypothetical protein
MCVAFRKRRTAISVLAFLSVIPSGNLLLPLLLPVLPQKYARRKINFSKTTQNSHVNPPSIKQTHKTPLHIADFSFPNLA